MDQDRLNSEHIKRRVASNLERAGTTIETTDNIVASSDRSLAITSRNQRLKKLARRMPVVANLAEGIFEWFAALRRFYRLRRDIYALEKNLRNIQIQAIPSYAHIITLQTELREIQARKSINLVLPHGRELREDETLCLIHLRKTAGTTLNQVIAAQFRPEDICEFREYYELPDYTWHLPAQFDIDQYRYLTGHIFYEWYVKLVHKNPVFVTMLRDPIRRTLSEMAQLRRDFAYFRGMGRFKNMSDEELLHDPVARFFLENHQTRMLASAFVADLKSLSDTETALATEKKTDVDVETAKRRLREFSFFGLSERFDDSLRLIAHTFGWRPVPEYQSFNISPRKLSVEELSPSVMDTIVSLNQLDLELYEYAQQLFATRYSRMVDNLLGNLLDRVIEHQHEQIYFSSPRSSLPLYFDFSQKVEGSGWHFAQKRADTDKGAVWYRWSGPGVESTLDFRLILDDAPIEVEFRVAAVATTDILTSLSLDVNGYTIPLTFQNDPQLGMLFQGSIPYSTLISSPELTRLAFRVNRTVPESSVAASAETRPIGFILDWLKLTLAVLPSRVDFDFSKPPKGDGWYPPERDGSTHLAWTGPGQETSLHVDIGARYDTTVELYVAGSLKADILNSLRLTVNDFFIPLWRTDSPAEGIVFQGEVPREVWLAAPGTSVLKFYVNQTCSPKSNDPTSSDDRALGIAFKRIRIYPKSEL